MLPDLLAGVWRHWKGHHYLVLGYGHDSNREGRQVVVYVGLQLDGAHTGPRLAVRDVRGPDGFFTPLADGRPRFAYVGPEWAGEPLVTGPGVDPGIPSL